VEHQHDASVLFQFASLAQIRQDWALVVAAFNAPVQLAKRHYGGVEGLGHGGEAAADVGDFCVTRTLPVTLGPNQPEVIDKHRARLDPLPRPLTVLAPSSLLNLADRKARPAIDLQRPGPDQFRRIPKGE
jgi:hypothetical protein